METTVFNIGSNSGAIRVLLVAAVCLTLIGFSVVYDRAVGAWLRRYKHASGFISLTVVVGCAVTIGGVGLLDLLLPEWNAGLLALLAFACSGANMILGSIRRFLAEADQAEADLVARINAAFQEMEHGPK